MPRNKQTTAPTLAALDRAVEQAFEELSAAALGRGAAARTTYGNKRATGQARKAALKRLDAAAQEFHRLAMLKAAFGRR